MTSVDERLMDACVGTLELFGVYLDTRLGLYRTLRAQVGDLRRARRAGADQRAVCREWLEQ